MLDKLFSKPSHTQHGFYLAFISSLLALCVVVLGAYTRLTDAGLGCPDWPGCYGHLIVPHHLAESWAGADATKAWTEMVHRYIAGVLGILIGILGISAIRNRHQATQPVLLPQILVAMVIFQAILGMWTVTLKLFPLVVMAHLMGGLTTLSLLWWLTLTLSSLRHRQINIPSHTRKSLKIIAGIGLCILIIQLFLGGWTSANYAALVCLDFPLCQGKLFPPFDISGAFNLLSAGVVGSPGTPLDNTARVTLQVMHRLWAFITLGVFGGLALKVYLSTHAIMLRRLSLSIVFLLIVQILLGITNILAVLPLSIAVLHNATAALLLLTVLTFLYYLGVSSEQPH